MNMSDMEKCFREPAEVSAVDDGKGNVIVEMKGSPAKLGYLVAQAADSIFKHFDDADKVEAMEKAIVETIRIMAMRRKAETKNGPDTFSMSGELNAIRNESALKEILKSVFGKQ